MSAAMYSRHALERINERYPGAGLESVRVSDDWIVDIRFKDGGYVTKEVEGESDSLRAVNSMNIVKDIVKRRSQKPKPASAYHE